MWKWLTPIKAFAGGLMMLFGSIVHVALMVIWFGAIVIEAPLADGTYSKAGHAATACFMFGWVCWLSARLDGVEQKIERK
jgi:hypothetical protein